MNTLARRIGCTEGQAYSLVITLAVALLLTLGGVLPVLRFTPRLQANDVPALAPVTQPTSAPVAAATPPRPVQTSLPSLAQLPLAPPILATDVPVATPTPTAGPTPIPGHDDRFPPVPVTDVPVLVQAGWSGPFNDGTTTPPGDLGLGNQLVVGQTISYYEVAWTGRSLTVDFDVAANINKDSTSAAAQICPITTATWKATDGGTTGPAYDCGKAIPAVLTVPGFTLDLSKVPLNGGLRSFALVPTGTTPFQAALRKRVFP